MAPKTLGRAPKDMVGAHLRAALRAGLKEGEFWRLTPYRLSERLDEARKLHLETCLLSGWFFERFAREERLQGPQSYIESMIERPRSQVRSRTGRGYGAG